MFIVIFCYDQLIFRPLVNWAEKFKVDSTPSETVGKPWITRLLQRTRLIRFTGNFFDLLGEAWFKLFSPSQKATAPKTPSRLPISRIINSLGYFAMLLTLVLAGLLLMYFVLANLSNHEIIHVFVLGAITCFRVVILILFASMIWIPIGVWIGLRPTATQIAQPIAQFLAAFPANLFYPIVFMLIVKYHLNIEIWATPLMILGTQWYILFNVIAGTAALPKDLQQVTANFGVKRSLWWRRLVLPGIYPYYITGAITAAGGAWNASIVAEVVSYGSTTLTATGVGAYIAQYTAAGDFPRIALGVSVMCIYVLLLNRALWRPLYTIAETRFQMD